MNNVALVYLKDLQQQLVELREDAENKLETINPENFRDDISGNVFEKIGDAIYEIETIMSDAEDGYYDNNAFDDNNTDDDLNEDF